MRHWQLLTTAGFKCNLMCVQMPHIKSAMTFHIIGFRLDRVGPVSVFCVLESLALLSSLLVLHNPCSYMCPPDDP